MSDVNPATPAKAATPGNNEPGSNTNPNANQPTPQPSGAAPGADEGKVTIPLTEYRQLQRDSARTAAAQKRNDIARRRANLPNADIDPNDPAAAELAKLRQDNEAKDRLLMQRDLRDKVSELFTKPEYSSLPDSTKKIILKNPSSLSNAQTIEEALLDIEEFLIEETSSSAAVQKKAAPGASPPGVETPPAVGTGAPAPTASGVLEDTSKLTGRDRTAAMLRNKFKEQQMGLK